MKPLDRNLTTPIYAKTHSRLRWPTDQPVFYLLSANGLFLCRNNPFFRSCTPARHGPGELAQQKVFLDSRYPKVPQELLEAAVGFFGLVQEEHGCEAVLLLGWDHRDRRVRLFVPRQRCTVTLNHSGICPVGVHYQVPAGLPEGLGIFGDLHSHADGAAYASLTDQLDEHHRPGLHVVVGRISEEPPEFHVEATADGVRFKLDPAQVFEGYRRRAEVGRHCLDQIQVEHLAPIRPGWGDDWTGCAGDPAVNIRPTAACGRNGTLPARDGENDEEIS